MWCQGRDAKRICNPRFGCFIRLKHAGLYTIANDPFGVPG